MSRIRPEVLVEAVLEILDDAVFTHHAGGRARVRAAWAEGPTPVVLESVGKEIDP